MTQLRILNASNMPAARRVWEICFPNDEAPFVAYYFERRTRPEWILGAFEGSDLIGTVHMLPHTARFFGEERRVGFSAGVATLPAFRARGVAGEMIEASFSILRERGFSLAMLKPFSQSLARFYERFGYRPYACTDTYRFTTDDLQDVDDVTVYTPDATELLSVYRAFAAPYNGVRVRTVGGMALLLEEVETYGGEVLLGGGAYAACYRGEGGAHAFELAGKSPLPLLKALAQKYGAVHASLPAGENLVADKAFVREVFNMVRLLDEDAFFKGMQTDTKTRFYENEAAFSLEMY